MSPKLLLLIFDSIHRIIIWFCHLFDQSMSERETVTKSTNVF